MQYFCAFKIFGKDYNDRTEASCILNVVGIPKDQVFDEVLKEIKKQYADKYGENPSLIVTAFNQLPDVEETFEEFVDRKYKSSLNIFGPGERLEGIIAHIKKELDEILKNPKDKFEWADLILLGIDGASRQGITGEELLDACKEKWSIVESRTYPDWRTMGQDQPIEHIREND